MEYYGSWAKKEVFDEKRKKIIIDLDSKKIVNVKFRGNIKFEHR